MASLNKPAEPAPRKRRPPTTPQARENQLINLAFTVAEQQMLNGTASAQVITHYLKLGSSREKQEQARLKAENELLKGKLNSMEAQGQSGADAREALDAFRAYAGHEPGQDEDYYDN